MRFFENRALRSLTKKFGQESDVFDFEHEIDRSLSFGENKRMLSKKMGISTFQIPDDDAAYTASMNARQNAEYQNSLNLRTYSPRRRVPSRDYHRSKERDLRYAAQPLGRRVSVSGRVYYEWRTNHGDKDPGRRL